MRQLVYTVATWTLLLAGIAGESVLDSDGIESAISLYLKNYKPSPTGASNLKKKNPVDIKPLEESAYNKIFPEVKHHKVATAALSSVDDPSLDNVVHTASSIIKRTSSRRKDVTVYKNCRSSKMFALTFDEGPNFGNTEKILNTLKSKGVEATFHICAQFLPGTRDLVKKIVRDGHLLGMRFNPLITDLRGLSEAQLRKQLKNDQSIIYDNTGVRVKFLRLPFGGYAERELQIIASMGFIVTEHNLESYDFQEGKIMSAFKTKLNECKAYGCSGIISVQRDASPETAKRLPAIIDMIDDVGYNFVKLDKCVKGAN